MFLKLLQVLQYTEKRILVSIILFVNKKLVIVKKYSTYIIYLFMLA